MVNETMIPLLSILIWFPVLSGVLVLAVGAKNKCVAKALALLASGATLLFSVFLAYGFNSVSAQFQFIEKLNWFDSLNIYYHLGVDGISLPLIILTALMTLIAVASSWRAIKQHAIQYYAAFLIMEGLMFGVFAALDSILFYVFWEAMLIPMFLIIGIWGGKRRIYATIKFFLYTLLGSILMLVALLYLHSKAVAISPEHSFSILFFHDLAVNLLVQKWLFIAFLVAFAVKVPMWPVHTWLPDAHTEAPTAGSVILAAITLKMGAYGFLRFILPILPDASQYFAPFISVLSLVAVVYIGFVAIMQQDMKKLIAYSSIAHMGFVTLGFFMIFNLINSNSNPDLALMGVEGGYFQMISHGFISAAMFLCVGVLYDRMHTRDIMDYGGVANTMPIFASFMMLFALANAGLPGTSGFVGEFLVIMAAFKANIWYAFFAATTLILGAAYTLWMYKRVIFGEVNNQQVAALQDINRRELAILSILALTVLVFGLKPKPIMDMSHASLKHVIEQAAKSKV